MNEEIRYGEEVRQKMLRGVEQLFSAVSVTLGPKGRNVIIERGFGGPLVTKDGVTVAKEVFLADKFENLGAQLIKEAATKTNQVAGDGTTTATVLAYAIVKEGIKMVTAGYDPMEIKRGLDAALERALQGIDAIKTDVDDRDDILHVASISANNDSMIGEIIAQAFDHIGKDGVITVEDSNTMATVVDYKEGMKLDRGYITGYFANQNDYSTMFKNPKILLVQRPITQLTDILPLLDICTKRRWPLVIIAEDVSGDALSGLIMNTQRQVIEAVAIKTPGFGSGKLGMLDDIAVATGARVVNETKGDEWKNVDDTWLGSCEQIKVTTAFTTIIGPKGEEAKIEERLVELRQQAAEADNSLDREHIADRLSRLSGGVAVIKVGAVTEAELKEKKHRVEDALNATRAALEDGIVPGGGTTLVRVANTMAKEQTIKVRNQRTVGVNAGWDIFLRACEYPLRTIAANAGARVDVIVDQVSSAKGSRGWNAAKDKMEDLIKAGVIDPAKVTKSALKHATSVAGLLLTTECAIVDYGAVSVVSNEPAIDQMMGG
jgi:chaperonin GroEL